MDAKKIIWIMKWFFLTYHNSHIIRKTSTRETIQKKSIFLNAYFDPVNINNVELFQSVNSTFLIIHY